MFDEFRWKPRKVTAAVIGWPSAALLGGSLVGMLVVPPTVALWGVGLALLGIAAAVVVASKTLRAKIGAAFRKRA